MDQRAPILKAYLSRAPGGRRHFDVRASAPLSSFEAVARPTPCSASRGKQAWPRRATIRLFSCRSVPPEESVGDLASRCTQRPPIGAAG